MVCQAINVWLRPLSSAEGVPREYIAMGWNGENFVAMPGKDNRPIVINAFLLNEQVNKEHQDRRKKINAQAIKSQISDAEVLRQVGRGRLRTGVSIYDLPSFRE